ncbi:peptidase M61 [Dyadobacter sp. LJ53]|uniref:M61 family metallopeptidase n=1 Tax=Dyadobacter chenwenxiniae TaxID=2906456 RepID=UPI001F1EA434|nr:peptidase M61 [Dyadobacter chenwenxiniae]MCF0048958.1 peptidase M61 [Dyadobacter chenwenxiniae]
MKNFRHIIVLLAVSIKLAAQPQTANYQYKIDLLNVKDDKVLVTFTPPQNNLKEGKYIIPRMVPGYYHAMDFGQYISDFKAVDHKGKPIEVKKLDVNTWMVADLKNAAEISYLVSDGWEHLTQQTGGAKSPASMFKKDSLFIINYNSLVGYFDEVTTAGYDITVKKNTEFYPSSALKYIPKNDTIDVTSAKDYRHLVDSPVFYCVPDTTWLKVGNTNVLVSFFSGEHKSFSKNLATKLETILTNQQTYLGGKLPVNEYAFLIYHEEMPRGLLGDGLEHSNSTVCLYASPTLDKLPEALMGVASHEFFHILTPLNIHSGEIQEFNFLNPVLSKHLWLYEGMTEYATIHMPVKQRMISLPDFAKVIEGKVKGMEQFDNHLSMTEMSAKAIDRQDQYMNFYQTGPLVGLCLDIRLRELSGGKIGTQDLMQKLMKKFGSEKAFKDEELFDEITAMTFPEIRQFFKDYVEQGEPIPLKESLQKAGLAYDQASKVITAIDNPSKSQLSLRKAWINQ